MLGLRGELLIPESPHGCSNACANAAWLGRAEVKCTGPTRRSHIYSDNTRGRSKQSRTCRRQKRKQCKQKLIRAWDTHVCKPTGARKQPTGDRAPLLYVRRRRVVTGCGQMRSSDVNRRGRRRAGCRFARVLHMCVSLSGRRERSDWVEDKGGSRFCSVQWSSLPTRLQFNWRLWQ